jgi:hypothetical protein
MDATIERSGTEARHDMAGHPERTRRHEEALGTYLAALAYGERRTRLGRPDDEEPQPVDEPLAVDEPIARRSGARRRSR